MGNEIGKVPSEPIKFESVADETRHVCKEVNDQIVAAVEILASRAQGLDLMMAARTKGGTVKAKDLTKEARSLQQAQKRERALLSKQISQLRKLQTSGIRIAEKANVKGMVNWTANVLSTLYKQTNALQQRGIKDQGFTSGIKNNITATVVTFKKHQRDRISMTGQKVEAQRALLKTGIQEGGWSNLKGNGRLFTKVENAMYGAFGKLQRKDIAVSDADLRDMEAVLARQPKVEATLKNLNKHRSALQDLKQSLIEAREEAKTGLKDKDVTWADKINYQGELERANEKLKVVNKLLAITADSLENRWLKKALPDVTEEADKIASDIREVLELPVAPPPIMRRQTLVAAPEAAAAPAPTPPTGEQLDALSTGLSTIKVYIEEHLDRLMEEDAKDTREGHLSSDGKRDLKRNLNALIDLQDQLKEAIDEGIPRLKDRLATWNEVQEGEETMGPQEHLQKYRKLHDSGLDAIENLEASRGTQEEVDQRFDIAKGRVEEEFLFTQNPIYQDVLVVLEKLQERAKEGARIGRSPDFDALRNVLNTVGLEADIPENDLRHINQRREQYLARLGELRRLIAGTFTADEQLSARIATFDVELVDQIRLVSKELEKSRQSKKVQGLVEESLSRSLEALYDKAAQLGILRRNI